MGENGNRILMALLTGLFVVLSVSFLNALLFHKQKFDVIGGDTQAVVEVDNEADAICHLLADADISIGETIAKSQCTACHNFANEVAGQGPHLVSLVGRDIASTDFGYSGTLNGLPGDWTYEELNGFLFNPKLYAPGTKMNFNGWNDSERNLKTRANVIAYLYSNSGVELPSSCPVIEEEMDDEVVVEDVVEEESTY